MIYNDPPYNIGLSYDKGLNNQGKYGGKTNDKKSSEEYRTFLRLTLENALMVSKPDCHVFYWCDEDYITMIQELYKDAGVHF